MFLFNERFSINVSFFLHLFYYLKKLFVKHLGNRKKALYLRILFFSSEGSGISNSLFFSASSRLNSDGLTVRNCSSSVLLTVNVFVFSFPDLFLPAIVLNLNNKDKKM